MNQPNERQGKIFIATKPLSISALFFLWWNIRKSRRATNDAGKRSIWMDSLKCDLIYLLRCSYSALAIFGFGFLGIKCNFNTAFNRIYCHQIQFHRYCMYSVYTYILCCRKWFFPSIAIEIRITADFKEAKIGIHNSLATKTKHIFNWSWCDP